VKLLLTACNNGDGKTQEIGCSDRVRQWWWQQQRCWHWSGNY